MSSEFHLLKVDVFYIGLHNPQGGLFPPHGPELPATSTLGKTYLIRWSFKLLLFLKPALGIFVKTFPCYSSGASKMCDSSKMFLMLLNTR